MFDFFTPYTGPEQITSLELEAPPNFRPMQTRRRTRGAAQWPPCRMR
jgi:hypothetical protein